MPAGPVGGREREILTAIVETFIASGEPVGSRTLARASREGPECRYDPQRHGRSCRRRIPRAAACFGRTRAYRGGLSLLCRAAEWRGSSLATRTRASSRTRLTGVTDVAEFMERTSHVLSLISHGVGVTVATTGPRNALEHVYFSRLSDQKVLAVVVTRSGVVRDRVLRLDLRNPISIWRRATSTRIFAAGPWATCAPSWPAAWSRNAASTTG
jgi:heat-inducible transcriptional repressor